MRPLQTNLSVFKKFNFDKPPIGIKYLFHKPEGIEQLDKSLAFCEMLKESHQRETPFYFTKQNEDCFGKVALGMEDVPIFIRSGELGVKYGTFQEPRANASIMHRLARITPLMGKGVVNYVAYSQLDKITFEPDLLVLKCTPSQAEIVMRAMSYSTGELWQSVTTPGFACASLYIYPYLSGKINYTITGMSFGMKAKQVFSDGWILISIPYHWIPTMVRNLSEMTWTLPSYTDGSKEKFSQRRQKIMDELVEESLNA